MGRVLEAYRKRLAASEIDLDPAQEQAVERLDRLALELAALKPVRRSLFAFRRSQEPPPKGLYIHGAVGRGKTMLMDLFFEAASVTAKRRVHFHEFMSEAHDRIGRGRATTDGDPIPYVASEIASETRLLCFDELHVTDIADAMILSRLFKGLFEKGVVVVATSNAAPDRLYWNGLNRQLFMPFIELLKAHAEPIELKSAKDFRLDKLAGHPLYFTPDDAAARAELDQHWERLTGNHEPAPAMLDVKGRKVLIPHAAMGVARFGFADLCAKPLGATDYLAIAESYATIIVDGIPVMTAAERNEARRFVNLIDTLYDQRVCLIASAEAEPVGLYPEGDGAELFERTVSRLMEMRSEAYLTGGRDPGKDT